MAPSVRKKVKLAFIVNESQRKISYEKRKKSLLKKLGELTILCGIEACAIVESDFDSQPEVWPSPLQFLRVVTKYRHVPQMAMSRKTLNQESYLMQRIHKSERQLAKMKKNNKENKMSLLMFQCLNQPNVVDNLSMVDLTDMNWVVNQKLEKVNMRMNALENMASYTTQSQIQVAAASTVAVAVADVETRLGEEAQGDNGQRLEMNMFTMQNEPWYMDSINGQGIEMVPFGDVNYQAK